jgi:glycine cleavage system aminomethyltransferase T
VTESWLSSGDWQVEIAWQRHAVQVQVRPWYDPKGERLKG